MPISSTNSAARPPTGGRYPASKTLSGKPERQLILSRRIAAARCARSMSISVWS